MPTADLVQQIITAGGSVTDAVNVFGQAGEAGKGIVTLQPYKEGSLILSVPVAECLYMPHPLPVRRRGLGHIAHQAENIY